MKSAAEREREELDDKWHSDQPILGRLAQKANGDRRGPLAAFAYRSKPPEDTISSAPAASSPM